MTRAELIGRRAGRIIILLLLIIFIPGCAAHHQAAGATPAPLVLSEQLPGDTQLCVLLNPWVGTRLACVSVQELRTYIRLTRQAHLEAAR